MRRGPPWGLGDPLAARLCDTLWVRQGIAVHSAWLREMWHHDGRSTLESHRCVSSVGEKLEGAFTAACAELQAGKISAAAAQDRAWTSLEMIIPHYNEECIAG